MGARCARCILALLIAGDTWNVSPLVGLIGLYAKVHRQS
jgi:hypothetical protein